MKALKIKLEYNIAITVIGVALLLVFMFANMTSSYGSGLLAGLGSSLVVGGVIGIIYSIRLRNNPQKAKSVEIAQSEERTQYIRMKTGSAVNLVMLFVISFACIIVGLVGFKEVSMAFAVLIVVQSILYVIMTRYYDKKY